MLESTMHVVRERSGKFVQVMRDCPHLEADFFVAQRFDAVFYMVLPFQVVGLLDL